MNNTVLRILKIFEEETDEDNMLTKNEIIDILVSEGFESINEKQFYRKIEELKNNGYDIETKRGRQTKYFLRKARLSREEWIYLLTIIMGNKDLSTQETQHIIESLENMNVCWKSIDYAEKYINNFNYEKSKINKLKNFRLILNAIDNKNEITYTELIKNGDELEFSERKKMTPVDFYYDNNSIIIRGKENSMPLSSIIDIEIN